MVSSGLDEKKEPEILYMDQWLVAVDKPAGLMVHRSGLSRGVLRFATDVVGALVGASVHPIHRIDRPTSGVLLFALDKETLREVSGQFARREVLKSYRAVVRGHMEPEGHIDSPLERGPGEPKKEAITLWKTLWQTELQYNVGRYPTARYSMLELTPKTGRRHQLRRHCARLRHPIIGDTSHGDRHHNRFFRETLHLPSLFLFAQSLSVLHPHTGVRLAIHAPLPARFETFKALCSDLGA